MVEKNERTIKDKGMRIVFHPERLDVELNASISRQKINLFFVLLAAILLLLASALNPETRKLLLEVLLGAVQLLVTIPTKPEQS